MVFSAIASIVFINVVLPLSDRDQKAALPVDVVRQLGRGAVGGDLRVKRVDLNNDGRPELIVQSGCAAVGNCSTWVFRKAKGGYKAFLRDAGGSNGENGPARERRVPRFDS